MFQGPPGEQGLVQGLARWEDRVLVGPTVGQDLSPEGPWETQQINPCPQGPLLQTESELTEWGGQLPSGQTGG